MTVARSLHKYHWEINDTREPELVRELSRAFDIPAAGARWLVSRGYRTPEEAQDYLMSDDTPPHDPFLFDNMEEAVAKVRDAIEHKKTVMVHGDYDVDGICGTAILYHFLKGLVPEVYRFVPDRRKDGYGMSTRAVDWAIDRKVGLVIAVDCGTSDGEQVARLEEAGIDVIVCDHHELPIDKEVRGVLLNPCRDGEGYPSSGLCGTGVAFKLLCGLEARGIHGSVSVDSLLDLVAIATVGDLAPLKDENRRYVRAGLERINTNRRLGLSALVSAARLDAERISATHIGFNIAPRLNAPGRISNPKRSLEILCASDPAEASSHARFLEEQNDERRELTNKVEDEVFERIAAMSDRDELGGFVLAGSDWDEGVLGIAASRVVDEFGRPAVLITLAGDVAKGSGRSVRGVHLKEQLDLCKDFLIKYGGHSQAAGLSVDKDKVDGFAAALTERLATATADLPKRPTLRIDAELGLHELTMELLEFLALCEPFGYGNRTPVWLIRNVEIKSDTRIVGGKHLKLYVRDARGAETEAISFNWTQRGVAPEALHGRKVDLAVTVKRGFFLDKVYPEVHVRDMREHGGS